MSRAEVFAHQLEVSRAAGRRGFPIFALVDAVEPARGACISCGWPITHAEAHADEVPCCLRCDECLAAIAVAMGAA